MLKQWLKSLNEGTLCTWKMFLEDMLVKMQCHRSAALLGFVTPGEHPQTHSTCYCWCSPELDGKAALLKILCAMLGDWRTQAETELGASWVTIGPGQDGCLGCQRICGSMLSPK